jgi:hypothetical protein
MTTSVPEPVREPQETDATIQPLSGPIGDGPATCSIVEHVLDVHGGRASGFTITYPAPQSGEGSSTLSEMRAAGDGDELDARKWESSIPGFKYVEFVDEQEALMTPRQEGVKPIILYDETTSPGVRAAGFAVHFAHAAQLVAGVQAPCRVIEAECFTDGGRNVTIWMIAKDNRVTLQGKRKFTAPDGAVDSEHEDTSRWFFDGIRSAEDLTSLPLVVCGDFTRMDLAYARSWQFSAFSRAQISRWSGAIQSDTRLLRIFKSPTPNVNAAIDLQRDDLAALVEADIKTEARSLRFSGEVTSRSMQGVVRLLKFAGLGSGRHVHLLFKQDRAVCDKMRDCLVRVSGVGTSSYIGERMETLTEWVERAKRELEGLRRQPKSSESLLDFEGVDLPLGLSPDILEFGFAIIRMVQGSGTCAPSTAGVGAHWLVAAGTRRRLTRSFVKAMRPGPAPNAREKLVEVIRALKFIRCKRLRDEIAEDLETRPRALEPLWYAAAALGKASQLAEIIGPVIGVTLPDVLEKLKERLAVVLEATRSKRSEEQRQQLDEWFESTPSDSVTRKQVEQLDDMIPEADQETISRLLEQKTVKQWKVELWHPETKTKTRADAWEALDRWHKLALPGNADTVGLALEKARKLGAAKRWDRATVCHELSMALWQLCEAAKGQLREDIEALESFGAGQDPARLFARLLPLLESAAKGAKALELNLKKEEGVAGLEELTAAVERLQFCARECRSKRDGASWIRAHEALAAVGLQPSSLFVAPPTANPLSQVRGSRSALFRLGLLLRGQPTMGLVDQVIGTRVGFRTLFVGRGSPARVSYEGALNILDKAPVAFLTKMRIKPEFRRFAQSGRTVFVPTEGGLEESCGEKPGARDSAWYDAVEVAVPEWVAAILGTLSSVSVPSQPPDAKHAQLILKIVEGPRVNWEKLGKREYALARENGKEYWLVLQNWWRLLQFLLIPLAYVLMCGGVVNYVACGELPLDFLESILTTDDVQIESADVDDEDELDDDDEAGA